MATRTDRWQSEPGLGGRWLIVARMGAAVLMSVFALAMRDAARWPELLNLAAGAAAVAGALTWVGGDRRPWDVLLFLADLVWITLAVLATGSLDAGLTMLFPLVAFAAGLCVGGRAALVLSLLAGLALVVAALAVSPEGKPPGWIAIQGILVLVLGGVTDRTRGVMLSREQALAFASRALEKMRLDSESVVQNLGSGLLTLDRQGSIVHVNRVAERMLDIEGRGVRGKPAVSALPPGAGPLVQVLLSGLSRGEPVRREEVELTLRDGKFPVGVGVSLLANAKGEPTGVVGLFQDLTEVRRQDLLQRRRDRLAAVGELAAGIAHEIRNSVLPISGSVQILAQEVALNEDQARLFEVIERETENVERFVGELLNYTRTDALRPVALDLRTVAEEAAVTQELSRKGGARIRVEGAAAPARAGADQIRQAVRNLVLNASDAAGPEGTVVIRTGTGEDGRAWIEVEDDGPGVSAAERDLIFQPFYTNKPGGTGLGLPRVPRIVEDHDGALELVSEPGKGARFRIVLGAARAGAREAAAA